MTLEQWKGLPLLLRRGDVLRVTGWGGRTYREEIAKGGMLADGVVGVDGKAQKMIRKAVLAKVVGLPI